MVDKEQLFFTGNSLVTKEMAPFILFVSPVDAPAGEPTKVEVANPAGTVLFDGDELLEYVRVKSKELFLKRMDEFLINQGSTLALPKGPKIIT